MLARTIAVVVAFAALASCTTTGERTGGVERMYVIDCGEHRITDLSRWTTPADKGKAQVFSNHCYLVKHALGWMLWDSGNADRIAAMPNGQSVMGGVLTQFMRVPLAESLKEIGVAPAAIQHFAMSHGHGDHAGNANLFGASTLYIQAAEHDAIFGAEPAKFGFVPANFEKLRGAKTVRLNGEHDVFGDGSVVIKPAPGHTIGSQVLVVRLPKTGLVVLSGDLAHSTDNWNARRAPGFNYNGEQTVRSMNEIAAFMERTGAKIWITHDKAQHASIPKSPRWVE